MAKLRVKDKVALGEFIINAARDPALREAFVNDPNRHLEKLVDIPKDQVDADGNPVAHKIEVHVDTQFVTHMVLPWKNDVDRAMDRIDEQTNIYPDEYRPNSASYIDDARFPRRALFFRFGEYMFGRCKT